MFLKRVSILVLALTIGISVLKPSKSEAILGLTSTGPAAAVLGVLGGMMILGGGVYAIYDSSNGKGEWVFPSLVVAGVGVIFLDNDQKTLTSTEKYLSKIFYFVDDKDFISELSNVVATSIKNTPRQSLANGGVTALNMSPETLNSLFERSSLTVTQKERVQKLLLE